MLLESISTAIGELARRRWKITGRVQGVGFRPFVFRLAQEQGLSGFVHNGSDGVTIEGQGTELQLDRFDTSLRRQMPTSALVREILMSVVPIRSGEAGFLIENSTSHATPTAEIAADLAVCPACLAEMRDHADRRRYHYPLINCTQCGPRFSIIQKVPYDRPNTTMATYALCAECLKEYQTPTDRRFHAQPTACHQCGPKMHLIDLRGHSLDGDVIAGACKRLFSGQMVAIKGVGGFHLAVRADDEKAVQHLRHRKHRDAKPLAVMCRSLAIAKQLVELSDRGVALLTSPAAPIVLATRKAGGEIATSVAPGQHRLGVMLPYTPVHHMLMDELDLRVGALVMTSANDCDEPLIFNDDDASDRLIKICESVLIHDRAIERPVDDSVIIDSATDDPILLRRSRGYVPTPIKLSGIDNSTGIALGAELKSTVALVRGSEVILSQHLGDLTHARTYANFKRTIQDLCDLFAVKPAWIAHDLHPQYLSTMYGAQLAAKWRVPVVRVQHHYAHAAAVLAEHGHAGPALAVICDGTGYGTDGSTWGGELLSVDFKQFHRLGHLRPLRLPGGDIGAKQIWRCGVALLFHSLGKDFDGHPMFKTLVPDEKDRGLIVQMMRTNAQCDSTSSTGRFFDGVAALLGLCLENTFEAQGAMALESAASRFGQTKQSADFFSVDKRHEVMQLDFAPLIQELLTSLAHGMPVEELSALFHEQLSAGWEAMVLEAVDRTGLASVILSGGTMCNELLVKRLTERLNNVGLHVLRSRFVPPNDGGIAFGQAAVAAHRVRPTSATMTAR